jgi:MFS family permease
MTGTRFHGWRMVAVCLAVQAIAGGASIYLYSLFAGEVERAFEARRATVMLAATGHAIVSALIGPKLGQLMDGRHLKLTMVVCALAMGAGFILIPLVPSVWGFVAGFTLLVAVGSAGLTTLLTPVLLSRWFVRRRGLALGLAALGSQLGGFLLSPLAAFGITHVGWRWTMFSLGVFIAISISMLMWWAVIDRPERCGQHPDGEHPPADGQPATSDVNPEPPAWRALRDTNFWIAALGVGLIIAVFSAVLTNLSIFATDLGEPIERGARLLSLFALVGIIASPVIGRICDLVDIRVVFAGLIVLIVIALLVYASARTYLALAVATAVVAAAGGGVTPFIGALVGRLFELRVYGRAIGSLFLVAISVSSLVPFLSGLLYDAFGSYRAMFVTLAVLLVLPLFVIPRLRPLPTRNPAPGR